MKLYEITSLLDCKIFTKNIYQENIEISYAFSCDLMSDALMLLRNVGLDFCYSGVLITGLVTVQGVRTAEMLDLPLIILVRGKQPNELVIKEAEEANIIIIGTPETMFSTNGKLYKKGLIGITEYNAKL